MKKQKIVFNSSGFTLIEVLVAVGVLTVASLAFLPSYTKSFEGKKLQSASDVVRDATASARNRALTQAGGGQDDAMGYKYSVVKVENNSRDILLFRSTDLDVATCNSPAVIDSTIKLPEGTKATTSSTESPTCIFFAYKTGDCWSTKGTNPTNVTPCSNN
jgi:prepilin-type N-terminal cleavage/methylation domain-containing protein